MMLSMLSAYAQGGNGVRRVKAVNVNDMRFEFAYNFRSGNMPVAFTGVQGSKRINGTLVEEGDDILYIVSSSGGGDRIVSAMPKMNINEDIRLSVMVLYDKWPFIVKNTYLYFPLKDICKVKSSVREFIDKKTHEISDEMQPVGTLYEWNDDDNLVLIKSEDYSHKMSYCELENKKTSVDVSAFAGCIGDLDDSRLCLLNACLLNDLFHTKNLIAYEEQPDVKEIYSYTIDSRGYIESMTVVTELKSDGTRYGQRRITVEYED